MLVAASETAPGGEDLRRADNVYGDIQRVTGLRGNDFLVGGPATQNQEKPDVNRPGSMESGDREV